MTLDPAPVEAVTFDSFGTLVDVDSTATAVAAYVDDPVPFAREWHARAAHYATVANQIDAYETYYDLHVAALEYLLAVRGVSVPEAELREATDAYHDMDPFEDVRRGVDRLREAGYAVGVVSNGDPAMLASMVRVADLEDRLAATVSAHEVRTHKPARRLYEHAADRLGVAPDAVVHVSNGYTDVQGAMHAGAQGVWLDRQSRPPDPFGPDPDLAVETVDDLVARL